MSRSDGLPLHTMSTSTRATSMLLWQRNLQIVTLTTHSFLLNVTVNIEDVGNHPHVKSFRLMTVPSNLTPRSRHLSSRQLVTQVLRRTQCKPSTSSKTAWNQRSTSSAWDAVATTINSVRQHVPTRQTQRLQRMRCVANTRELIQLSSWKTCTAPCGQGILAESWHPYPA